MLELTKAYHNNLLQVSSFLPAPFLFHSLLSHYVSIMCCWQRSWCNWIAHLWNSILRVILCSHISVSSLHSTGEIWQKMLTNGEPAAAAWLFHNLKTSWKHQLCFVWQCYLSLANDEFDEKCNDVFTYRQQKKDKACPKTCGIYRDLSSTIFAISK